MCWNWQRTAHTCPGEALCISLYYLDEPRGSRVNPRGSGAWVKNPRFPYLVVGVVPPFIYNIPRVFPSPLRAEWRFPTLPTLTSTEPLKPTIIQHYALTFNSVDRINRLIGYINYLPRVDDNFLLIVSLVQIAIVETWALYGDWRVDARTLEEQGFDLQEFTVELANDLLN